MSSGSSLSLDFCGGGKRHFEKTNPDVDVKTFVEPERLFEGFENLTPTGHTQRLLRIVIICHIMKLCQ
jgi:hypothetical protein